MLTRKRIINIITFPIFIKSWRRSLRKRLKCYFLNTSYNYKKQFVQFKESLKLYKKAPDSFSFKKFDRPTVSIIIPVYNQYYYTHLCLWSILQNTKDISYEVIIADDCSTDETQTILERIKNICVIRPSQNLRFLKNCNNAAKHTRGKYILFLNNDTQVQPNWLKPLVDLIEKDNKIGLVGSQLLYPDGTLQEAGGIIFQDASGCNYGRNDIPVKEEYNYVKEVDYISGAAIMIKRDLWEKLRGFDERFAPAYYEDTDLAFQVRQQGLKVVYQPLSKVIHFEGKSNGRDVTSGQKQYQVVNQKKFYEKWRNVLQKNHGTVQNLFLARDRSLKKKTLLFIDASILTYDQDTGSKASFQYLEFFINHGLNVKFLSRHKAPQDYHLEKLQQIGVEVICLSDSANRYYTEWLKKNGLYIDYIYLNRPDVAEIYFYNLRKYTTAKIIYQGHDLHFSRLKQQYDIKKDKKILLKSEFFEQLEKKLIPKMDVISFFSKEEIQTIQSWGIEKTMDDVPLFVFDPNQMDKYTYHADKRSDILFIGGYRHVPNIDAAEFLVKEIMPKVWQKIPDMRVHLVGSHPPKEVLSLANHNVIVHGFVTDEELEKIYAQIKFSVIPLRFGAGVKGKVVESVYHKVPVLTTPVGGQSIPAVKSITIEENGKKLAEKIISLYQDNKTLNQLSEPCKDFIKSNYSEKTIFEKFSKWIEIR